MVGSVGGGEGAEVGVCSVEGGLLPVVGEEGVAATEKQIASVCCHLFQ